MPISVSSLLLTFPFSSCDSAGLDSPLPLEATPLPLLSPKLSNILENVLENGLGACKETQQESMDIADQNMDIADQFLVPLPKSLPSIAAPLSEAPSIDISASSAGNPLLENQMELPPPVKVPEAELLPGKMELLPANVEISDLLPKTGLLPAQTELLPAQTELLPAQTELLPAKTELLPAKTELPAAKTELPAANPPAETRYALVLCVRHENAMLVLCVLCL